MNIRYKIALFVVCLVALLAFQSKLVMPFAEKVAASGLFLEDSGDDGSQLSVSTDMTRDAFAQCNTYITKEMGEKHKFVFPKDPLHSWPMGNYEYVINADIQVTSANAASVTKRYACDIKYKNKSDKAGVADADNWSVIGLSGLSDL